MLTRGGGGQADVDEMLTRGGGVQNPRIMLTSFVNGPLLGTDHPTIIAVAGQIILMLYCCSLSVTTDTFHPIFLRDL